VDIEAICVIHVCNKAYEDIVRGETWTDLQRDDPNGCRLIGGDRELRA
jgi:hypothetical protein